MTHGRWKPEPQTSPTQGPRSLGAGRPWRQRLAPIWRGGAQGATGLVEGYTGFCEGACLSMFAGHTGCPLVTGKNVPLPLKRHRGLRSVSCCWRAALLLEIGRPHLRVWAGSTLPEHEGTNHRRPLRAHL